MLHTLSNKTRKRWLRLAGATLLSFGLLAVQAGFVLAEAPATTPPAQQTNSSLSTSAPVSIPTPLAGISVQQLSGRIVNYMLGIAGSIGLLMFVYGGVIWMTAAGNQDKIAEAKKTIVWSVMGLVMLFGSYIIVKFVMETIVGAQQKT